MPETLPRRLKTVDLFAELDDDELAQVAQLVRTRFVRRGESVVTHQDDTRDVYFVLSGAVRVTIYSQDGRFVTFRELEVGGSFGELAAIDGEPRSANVVAAEEVSVGLMSAGNFRNVVSRYPSVSLATLRKLAALVRSLSERVGEGVLPVPVRICRELIRLGEHTRQGRGAVLRPAPRRAELASRVNTHREAVSRLFSELARVGLIRKGEGEIVIVDVEALQRHAERLIDE